MARTSNQDNQKNFSFFQFPESDTFFSACIYTEPFPTTNGGIYDSERMFNNLNTRRGERNPSFISSEFVIYLDMPTSVTFADGLIWENYNTGLLAIITQAFENIRSADNVKDMLKEGGTGIVEVLRNLVTRTIADFADASVSTGIAVDSKLANYFKGANLRTFKLTWDLVPRNENETIAINNIIRHLRYASRPGVLSEESVKERTNPENNQSVSFPTRIFLEQVALARTGFTYPDLFNVEWLRRNQTTKDFEINPNIMQIGKMVCTGISVEEIRLGERFFGHIDGMPLGYRLSLDLTENAILHRGLININDPLGATY